MKRRIAKLGAAAAIAILLAGCSPSTGSNGAGDKDIKLTMIQALGSPERTDILDGLIAEFEAKYPGTTVELISPPTSGASTKILQMLTTKQDLDVVEVMHTTQAQYARNGYLADLTAQAEASPMWETLTPSAQDTSKTDGAVVAIPYGFYVPALFYRTDYLAAAGIDAPPTTWPEVLKTARAVTDKSAGRYGFAFRGGSYGAAAAMFNITAYNAQNLDQSAQYFLKSGKPVFTSPESKQALKDLLALFNDTSPADSVSWGYPEMVQGFTSGVSGQLIQTSEVIDAAAGTLEEGTWATAPMPLGPDGVGAPIPGAYAAWGVTSHSPNQERAWQLVEFLTDQENDLKFSKLNSMIPAQEIPEGDQTFSSGAFDAYRVMAADPIKFPVIDAMYSDPNTPDFQIMADSDLQSLLIGGTSVDEVLAKWTTYWTGKYPE
ncbi:sugar ABC transporter substrate-binding protein [Rhodoglobus aureus]|uniref:Sugar ABC transporter substrate-binding protein n=1 Tax=Rhodoglobus aureus TaxID=191497 RepID=A0ABP4FZS9_9MICO